MVNNISVTIIGFAVAVVISPDPSFSVAMDVDRNFSGVSVVF